ncbi:hypothetical protein [Streptococcus pseudopneumoniae]|uniref:hypothetical protein n=1 Tax=Streptococcus pseudopneumoniae TaxID=257758 RepID=UPI0014866D9C|nr:hypothetical protein [Streptococcus pseudopneumoniae]
MFIVCYIKINTQTNTPSIFSVLILEQTRKLASGCSKHCFEVVDKTDEVSDHIYGKMTLTWFEESSEEYKN